MESPTKLAGNDVNVETQAGSELLEWGLQIDHVYIAATINLNRKALF